MFVCLRGCAYLSVCVVGGGKGQMIKAYELTTVDLLPEGTVDVLKRGN